MRMTHGQLSALGVVTESGQELGKAHDMVYDIDAYSIVQLVVTGGMLKRHEYTISVEDIVKISDTRIVVRDAAVRPKASSSDVLPQGVSPAMMRKSN